MPQWPQFSAWTVEDARRAVIESTPPELDLVRDYYEGRQWRDGEGWIGPQPRGTDVGFYETMIEIERAFVSKNVVSEVVHRHRRGCVGVEPDFALVPRRALRNDEEPSAAEQVATDEAEAALTAWWDRRHMHTIVASAIDTLLWNGQACLRIYIPEAPEGSLIDENGVAIMHAPTLDDALDLIYIDHPLPEQSTVFVHPQTRREISVFLHQSDDDTTQLSAEMSWVERAIGVDRPPTVLRLASEAGVRDFTIDTGGHLLMYQMRRPALITTQVLQGQRALNLAVSIVPRNVVTGGFLERILLNAQMPGSWETDANGNRVRWLPEPYETGAGTTQFVRGLTTTDQDGNTVLATPAVAFREPIEVTPAVDAKLAHYQDVLDSVDQAHVLMNTEATPSGRSREQARADYAASLRDTAAPVTEMGRWLIETVLSLAEAFMSRPGLYTDQLRSTFTLRIAAGPVSADERQQNMDAAVQGQMSPETAMFLNGIADVDAEQARILSSPYGLLDLATRRATAIQTYVASGVSLEAAGELCGMKPDEIAVLVSGETFPQMQRIEAEAQAQTQVAQATQDSQTRNGRVPASTNGSTNGRAAPARARASA